MKTYCVYILKCSDGLLYTGMTNDVERRFDEHQQGLNKSSFTFNRRPVELIFYQDFNDVEQAIYCLVSQLYKDLNHSLQLPDSMQK